MWLYLDEENTSRAAEFMTGEGKMEMECQPGLRYRSSVVTKTSL